jgi:hypothetical protein
VKARTLRALDPPYFRGAALIGRLNAPHLALPIGGGNSDGPDGGLRPGLTEGLPLAVAEVWFPLFDEGCHALFLVCGCKHRVEDAAFKAEAFG